MSDYEDRLAKLLTAVVKQRDRERHERENPPKPGDLYPWKGWIVDFESLFIDREANSVTLNYSDSGVGEDYVVEALQMEFTQSKVEVTEVSGGCSSCGYGRLISIQIAGSREMPWQVASALSQAQQEALHGTEFYSALNEQIETMFGVLCGLGGLAV